MKIALVSGDELPPAPHRGQDASLTIEGLLPHLRKRAHVAVYSPRASGARSREDDGSGVHRHYPRRAYLGQVAADLAREEPAAAVVFDRPAWVPAIRRALPRGKVVLSLHSSRLDPPGTPPAAARQALAAADGVVAASRFLAARVARRFPGEAAKVHVVYPGVDPLRFAPGNPEAARRDLGLEDHGVILFVGRLTRSGGLHVVVEAMRHVLRHHPRARLLVIGGGAAWRAGSYLRRIRRRAARLGGAVRFTGPLPAGQLLRAFHAAEVLVRPSQGREPVSRVVYQAMACGLPVVTSARGADPEVVRHRWNGYLVWAFRSSRALGLALSEMLASPDREEMGRRARALILERYTWEAAAQRWLDLLAALAAPAAG